MTTEGKASTSAARKKAAATYKKRLLRDLPQNRAQAAAGG
jgi:hypothetical protein